MQLEIWQWGLLAVAILLIVGLVVMKTKKKLTSSSLKNPAKIQHEKF